MAQAAEPLSAPMLELLEWVRFRPRTHADAIEAWGSHCPRFTEWEDALDLALIELEPGGLATCRVRLTALGRTALQPRPW
jgi:hypothetical protein